MAARAWRKLLRRRIKPSTALHVVGRSCLKTLQLFSRLSLLVIGGSIVAVLMIVVRVASRLFRSKAGH